MRRIVFTLVLGLAMLLPLMPQSTSASSSVLRGHKIDRSGVLTGRTGKCTCEWTWYTVGLRRGVIEVSALLQTFASQGGGSTYGLRARLMQQGITRASAKAACPSSQWQCNKTLKLRYRVTRPGMYNLVFEGLNASGITYVMRIRGNIYPLRCRNC